MQPFEPLIESSRKLFNWAKLENVGISPYSNQTSAGFHLSLSKSWSGTEVEKTSFAFLTIGKLGKSLINLRGVFGNFLMNDLLS